MPQVQRVPLGYNNVYALDTPEGLVLVDAGPDYDGAAETLSDALGATQPLIVVATHGHLDHAGLGYHWQEAGTRVALGAPDAHLAARPALSSATEFERFTAYVRASGAPPEVCAEVLHGLEARREWARMAATKGPYPPAPRERRWPSGLRYTPFVPDTLVGDTGLPLPGDFQVLPMPGHTPGNCVVVHAGEGWLFSGDTVLPDITPTPAIQAHGTETHDGDDWRFHSLPAFVRSLRALEQMHMVRCFPGHGEPFDDVAVMLRANLSQVEERTSRVEAELRTGGPATVYGLCERIYPRAVRRRFWQIVATVQGHLDILESVGAAKQEGGRYLPT